MLRTSLSVAALLLLPLVHAGSSCLSVDANFNLLAFNLNGKDWDAGPKDQWATGTAKELGASGRPPFTGSKVNCHFSQFSNAVYVVGADSANPTDIWIYDAGSKAWSTQKINAPDGFDATALTAILDHDTNVFYGMSKGTLYSLAIGDTLSQATSEPKTWGAVSSPPWKTEGYNPVMGLGMNHIHFLNVPGDEPGNSRIFVIHFSYWQPEIQPFGDFANEHGQAPSIFLEEGAQKEFAFIPDSGANTYIINVESNTTRTLAGPSAKDASASYFGTPDSLIQLASNGAVNWIPISGTSATSATWSPVKALATVAPPSSPGSPSGGSVNGTSTSGNSSAGPASTPGTAANAAAETTAFGRGLALVLTASLMSAGVLAL